MLDPILYLWLLACCDHYGVEPAFVRAVALVESGGRCGLLGEEHLVYGPMGIHKDFLKRWPIDNPFVNVAVGVRALRNTDTVEKKMKRLKIYNASFNTAYWNAVMAAYRRGKR